MSAGKVAVLMGGPSGEHDISLKSGQGVVAALTQRGWTVVPIIIPRSPAIEEASEAVSRSLRGAGVDAVFIALHGPFGEDGTVQSVCDALHLPYTGSTARASRLGMDKTASKQRFEQAGLTVPHGMLVEYAKRPGRLNGFSFPFIIKPNGQGSSLGVSIVRGADQFTAAFAAAGRFGTGVIIEELIGGREVTVGVLGSVPLPVVEMRPRQPFFDFTAKYTAGLTDYLAPAPLPPGAAEAVQQAGLSAHRALRCRHFSRVDLIWSPERGPVVLEVNTIPGFTPMSLLPKAAACADISYDELCDRIVKMALRRSRQYAAV